MRGSSRTFGTSVNVSIPTKLVDRTKGTTALTEAFCGCGVGCDRGTAVGVIWTIIIGFLAGVIAKFLMPGKNEPSGFVLTTILGIVGAFVATFLGQSLGWYGPNEGAGLIGAAFGAIVVLAIWGFIARRA